MRRSASSSPSGARRTRNDSTRLSESIKKSAGRTSPASPARNLFRGPRVSSWDAHVRDHPPIPSTRRAMREKVRPIVGAAPGGDGRLGNAQFRRLPDENPPQIHVACGVLADPGAVPRRQPLQDFRTHFIARPTNANATMHYNFWRCHERLAPQQLHSLLQHGVERSEEHTSELQSRLHLVCRLLLEKKKKKNKKQLH